MAERMDSEFVFVAPAESLEDDLKLLKEAGSEWNETTLGIAQRIAERVLPRMRKDEHDEVVDRVMASLFPYSDQEHRGLLAVSMRHFMSDVSISIPSEYARAISPEVFVHFVEIFDRKIS